MIDESRKTELGVGIFLFVGLLLLGVLILKFSGLRETLKDSYEISVTFPSAAGLVEGAPVKLGGAAVGEIAEKPVLNDTFTGVISRDSLRMALLITWMVVVYWLPSQSCW